LFTLSPHKDDLKRWWSWWSEPGKPGKPGRMAPDSDEGGLKMWGWSAQPGRPIYWMRKGSDWIRAGAKDWIRAGSTGWMRSAPSDMKRIDFEPYKLNPMTRMATGDLIRLLTDDSSVPSEWINVTSDSYMLCRKSTRKCVYPRCKGGSPAFKCPDACKSGEAIVEIRKHPTNYLNHFPATDLECPDSQELPDWTKCTC